MRDLWGFVFRVRGLRFWVWVQEEVLGLGFLVLGLGFSVPRTTPSMNALAFFPCPSNGVMEVAVPVCQRQAKPYDGNTIAAVSAAV